MISKREILELIRSTAKSLYVDPNLAIAIAGHESNFDPLACRYEPKWNYLLSPERYARLNAITLETEITMQKMSYGLFQTMGSVCRELSFSGPLAALFQPEVNIVYGCKKIDQLKEKYLQEVELISSYNQGNPARLADGRFKNYQYVDGVMLRLKALRSIK